MSILRNSVMYWL